MITLVRGNIFNSNYQTITNPVNCAGVMGAGLALQFRNRFFLKYFQQYKEKCRTRELRPGQPHLCKLTTPWILNFPTKDDWAQKSEVKWIRQGLLWIRDTYVAEGITSLALPPLGCGLGGLNWEEFYDEAVEILSDLDLPIEIYQPREKT